MQTDRAVKVVALDLLQQYGVGAERLVLDMVRDSDVAGRHDIAAMWSRVLVAIPYLRTTHFLTN
ncbi:MAG: hypothetical protein WCK65_07225 [Rhodospirillaceae bacterium]